MSEDQEDVRNFDGLRDFIGRALKDVRENKKEGRKDLSECLRLVYGLREATEQWILRVEEDGKFHLLFDEFKILCQALEVSAKTVLGRAWELKKASAVKR